MTIASTQSNDNGASFRAQGSYSFSESGEDGALTISLGFVPRYFAWHNATDRISYEWFEGMAAGTTLKTVAAGTRTLDTGDAAISVNAGSGNQTGGAGTVGSGDGARVISDNTATQAVGVAPGGTVVIGDAATIEDKVCYWVAIG